MMISRLNYYFLLGVVFFTLGGCENAGLQEVKRWTEEATRQAKVAVPIMIEPKKFVPFVYSSKDEVDPFNQAKLSVVLVKQQALSTGNFKPDLDRRREPLESYPLDSIKMVGTLQKANFGYALLQVDKTVFQVKVGSYVGQNFGMVTMINEGAVELKEAVQDPSGEWVERKAKLELQESKK